VIAACSFCLKPNTDVGRLVAVPGVFICDECVALRAELIKGKPAWVGSQSTRDGRDLGADRRSPGNDPAVRLGALLRRGVKGKEGTDSSPLSIYRGPGGLRQDPGHAA